MRNIASHFVRVAPIDTFDGKVRWPVSVSPSCFRVTVGVPASWAVVTSKVQLAARDVERGLARMRRDAGHHEQHEERE